MGSGGALLASRTVGLTKSTIDRPLSVDTASDPGALLGIEGLSGCYSSQITLTNNGEGTFTVEITTDTIEVVDPTTGLRTNYAEFQIDPGIGSAVDVEFVPATGTSDDVQISATGEGESVEVTRQISVPPVSSNPVQLVAEHSGLGMVYNFGTGIVQGRVFTNWNVVLQDDCTYRIELSILSDYVVAPENRDTQGSRLVLEQWTGSDEQRWKILPIEGVDGRYRIENVHSGQVLDVNGNSKERGTAVIQWPWKGANPAVENQFWDIQEA